MSHKFQSLTTFLLHVATCKHVNKMSPKLPLFRHFVFWSKHFFESISPLVYAPLLYKWIIDLDCHNITEILLKAVLNTITPLNCMRLKQRVLIRLTYNIYYTYWAKATTCSLVVGNGWIFSVISSKYLNKLESHGISNGLLSVVGWVSASFWSCACSSSSFCFSSFSFCAFDFLMKEKYTVRL